MDRDQVMDPEDELIEEQEVLEESRPRNKRPLMILMGAAFLTMMLIGTAVLGQEAQGGSEEEEPEELEPANRNGRALRDIERPQPPTPELPPEPAPVEARSPSTGGGFSADAELRRARLEARNQRILREEQMEFDGALAARMSKTSVELDLGFEQQEAAAVSGGSATAPGPAASHPAMAYLTERLAAVGAAVGAAEGESLGVAAVPGGRRGGIGAGGPGSSGGAGAQQFYAEGGDQLAGGYLAQRRRYAQSPYELRMGAVIPGVMESGVISSLPGQLIGVVSQNVYDSATGQHLLIPQGSRLVGVYNSEVGSGQYRVQVAWVRINFPDGSMLDLEGMQGADGAGYSGFEDQVDRHIGRRIGLALLLTAFGVAFEATNGASARNAGSYGGSAVAAGVGDTLLQMGTEAVRQELNMAPTIRIRPGYRFNIMVNKDIVFDGPYVPARGY